MRDGSIEKHPFTEHLKKSLARTHKPIRVRSSPTIIGPQPLPLPLPAPASKQDSGVCCQTNFFHHCYSIVTTFAFV